MKFIYTNHKGETEERNVTPMALLFIHDPGSISGHLAGYDPGWFLECIAHDRGDDMRHFALDHIGKKHPEGQPEDHDIRLSLPTGIGNSFGWPYDAGSQMRADYTHGYGAGRVGELFDFGAVAAWAHGYNDGRRDFLATEGTIKQVDDIDPLGR
jgi:hypothetical protein